MKRDRVRKEIASSSEFKWRVEGQRLLIEVDRMTCKLAKLRIRVVTELARHQ